VAASPRPYTTRKDRAVTDGIPTANPPAVEPDEQVWLRDLDGTGSMHVCTPYCPGAVEYVRADLVVTFLA
jgi:hypothetical protein